MSSWLGTWGILGERSKAKYVHSYLSPKVGRAELAESSSPQGKRERGRNDEIGYQNSRVLDPARGRGAQGKNRAPPLFSVTFDTSTYTYSHIVREREGIPSYLKVVFNSCFSFVRSYVKPQAGNRRRVSLLRRTTDQISTRSNKVKEIRI